MVFGTLFAFPGDHPRSIGILAVAKANNLDLRVIDEPRIPEHLEVSRLGKVPAFHGEDGLKLFECIAIAIHANTPLVTLQNDKTTLLGQTKQDYVHILKWMSFFNTEIIIPMVEQYLPLTGIRPYNKDTVTTYAKMTQAAVDVVEEHLTKQTFLVGEDLTLADIFCAGIIAFGFQFFYGRSWREANPNVSRWYQDIVNQPMYSAVTRKVELLEEPKLINVAPSKKAETLEMCTDAAPPGEGVSAVE
ncbi:MAG: hypothetical protein Q9215_006835 [Flavoplaca cf. flavocitrina]